MRAQLGALLDDTLRRLALEPNLHDKRMVGQHAHELALTLTSLGGREQGHAEPDALAARVQERLSHLDPLGDEEEFRQLTMLAQQLERHALELPPRLVLFEAQTVPARDPFVEIGAEAPGPHADLNRALIVAEAAATTAVETPLETTVRLTALAAAKLDETALLETSLEAPWGSEPVDLSGYDALLALPVADRVEQLLREGAGSDEDPAL